MFVLWWIFLIIQFHFIRSGYIEFVTISGCESCRLLLTCRHLSSIIAILKVDFETNPNNEQGIAGFINNTELPPVHPREALNYRCSGMNHCSFELTEDCPESRNWGAGNITIKYACILENKITKYCNSEIRLPNSSRRGISQGFIHSPGYPRFYSGEDCHWKITAPPRQKLQLTIVDLSLIAENRDECSDVLEIVDGDQLIYTTCRQQYPPEVLTSGTESVEIVLKAKYEINPRRGVFIHYTAVGCPTLDAPEDGYLVYRNDVVAEYHCCVGYQFPGTAKRQKVIECLGAYWNESLPLYCERISNSNTFNKGDSTYKVKYLFKDEMNADLIAPALLILALFLINGIVLFYIYRVKQRNAMEIKEEELGTLTSTSQTAAT